MIFRKGYFYLILLSIFSISGCSTTDSAVFVTKSTIGVIDVDSTPGTVSFAYDREEGYFGPNYESGAVPPVVGSMRSSGEIINPTIKQLYATGEAATLVVDESATDYTPGDTDKLIGERKALVFGTSTSLGFKVGVTNSNPTFTLGYKRKEASFIPIHKSPNNDEEIYSSVLASIDTTITTDANGNEFENGQYFATGEAAKLLATQPYIKKAFRDRAKSSLESYDEHFSKQVQFHSGVTRCAFNISPTDWKSVIDGGIAANLFAGLDDSLKTALDKYTKSKSSEDKITLMQLYSEAIAGGINPNIEHSLLLESHEKLVCNLARS